MTRISVERRQQVFRGPLAEAQTVFLMAGLRSMRSHIEVLPSERILIVGEPSAGNTVLVLALAGLWPWRTGTIRSVGGP